jgi:hypothetical protein
VENPSFVDHFPRETMVFSHIFLYVYSRVAFDNPTISKIYVAMQDHHVKEEHHISGNYKF